jgi:hypothetical protein
VNFRSGRGRPFVSLSITVLALVTVVATVGCGGPAVQPRSQEPSTERREVGPFESLLVANAIRVRVHVGDAKALSVTAEPDVLPHVVTTVTNGKLSIGMDGTTTGIRLVEVELSVPALSSIEANTSADVSAEGFADQDLRLSVASSATVTAAGSIADLDVVGTSSGRLLLASLPGRTARIDIGTSAEAELAASDVISGSVHESGKLRILGNPGRVDVTVTTSGQVSRDG